MILPIGATVLFEVDARELHNHEVIRFFEFSRVIFNFPLADRHNIKKNRALLSDFFSRLALTVQLINSQGQLEEIQTQSSDSMSDALSIRRQGQPIILFFPCWQHFIILKFSSYLLSRYDFA